jgi:oryzin
MSAVAVPNQYIGVFKQYTTDDLCDEHLQWAQTAHAKVAALRAESDGPELTGVGERFSFPDLTGYVGSFDDALKNEIADREEVTISPALAAQIFGVLIDGIQVDFVEPDYTVYASGLVTQNPVPSWGLARISSKKKVPNPPVNLPYVYDSTAGEGTRAYVLDTGILVTHTVLPLIPRYWPSSRLTETGL